MPHNSQIIIYQSDDGKISVDALLQEESIWLNAHQMAELFEIDRSGIVKHIKNIYETGELEPKTTGAKIAQVAKDGKTREMDFYNLDAIISVGYRVNSLRGTQFRIWATQRLKEYLLQGFSLKELTKHDAGTAKNYLDEKEMKTLGLVVEQYLAFSESMAQNETPMTMADWISQLDLILKMNRKELLTHYGKISHALAVAKSEKEFDTFKAQQRKIEKTESLKELEADLKQISHKHHD